MLAKQTIGLAVAFGVALAAPGCTKKEFKESITLHNKVDKDGNELANSGEVLDPHVLNNGYEAYMLYCYACHGEHGDGAGPAAATMRPPPRNFTRGIFKFPGTGFGQLPVDSALDRVIRRGLHGTPMLPWDIPEVERKAIIAYLKTLSPRWKEEGVPPEIEVAPDPWKGKSKEEAIALGRQVYHVAQDGAGCSGCHASYETRADISAISQKVTGEGVAEFAEEMYRTALKESEYPTVNAFGARRRGCEVAVAPITGDLDAVAIQVNGLSIDRDKEHKEGWDYIPAAVEKEGEHGKHHGSLGDTITFFGKACEAVKTSAAEPSLAFTRPHQLLPPDFFYHRVKTAYPVSTAINEGSLDYVTYTEEMQRTDLYRTIGVGIGGAAMPGWKGVLSEEKLWALVYYVQSLVEKRDTPEAFATRAKLEGQPAWVAPAPPAPPAEAPKK